MTLRFAHASIFVFALLLASCSRVAQKTGGEKLIPWYTPVADVHLLPPMSHDPKSITQDARGHLWFGSLDGATEIEEATGKWRTYTSIDGLGEDAVQNVIAQGDVVWFCGLTSVSWFNTKTGIWKSLESPVIIPEIVITTKGAVYLYGVVPSGEVFIYQPETEKFVPVALRTNQGSEFGWYAASGNDGVLWLSSPSNALFRLEPQETTVHQFSIPGLLKGEKVLSLLELSDRKLLLATNTAVLRYDPRSGQCSRIDLPEHDAFGSTLMEDHRHAIWLSGAGELFQLDQTTQAWRKIQDFPFERQRFASCGFEDSQNRIWCHGSKDVASLSTDRHSWRLLRGFSARVGNQISSLGITNEGSDAVVWASSEYSTGSSETYWSTVLLSPLAKTWKVLTVSSLLEPDFIRMDKAGNAWWYDNFLGGLEAVARNGDAWLIGSEFSRRPVNDSLEDRTGTVWVAGSDGSLDACSWQSRSCTPAGILQALKPKAVKAIFEDSSGKVWFGTDRFLAEYDPGNRQ